MKKNDTLTVGANVAPDGSVDRYPDVFNLLSHVDDLEPEDLFQVKPDQVLSKNSKLDRFTIVHSFLRCSETVKLTRKSEQIRVILKGEVSLYH